MASYKYNRRACLPVKLQDYYPMGGRIAEFLGMKSPKMTPRHRFRKKSVSKNQYFVIFFTINEFSSMKKEDLGMSGYFTVPKAPKYFHPLSTRCFGLFDGPRGTNLIKSNPT